ncbi:hypothetical protein [Streptomyces sp. GZWMJZ-114]|uniref:hypothetical protein n=1 Tax=unclassified Streptomyces TaxID=2593676 RepID=UPI001F50BA21|nr:hypothetical protein [Streptomyces sp. GZWMJZ-114]
MATALTSWDRTLFTKIASARLSGAEQALPALSSAANQGKVWLAASVALSVVGDRAARRGAVRGMGPSPWPL